MNRARPESACSQESLQRVKHKIVLASQQRYSGGDSGIGKEDE